MKKKFSILILTALMLPTLYSWAKITNIATQSNNQILLKTSSGTLIRATINPNDVIKMAELTND